MKLRGFWYDKLLICLFAAFVAVFVLLTALLEPKLAVAELVIAIVILGIATYRVLSAKHRYKKFMETASTTLDYSQAKVLASFPFPAVVCNRRGYICWCSKAFYSDIANGELNQASHIDMFTNGIGLDNIVEEEETHVQIDRKSVV